MTHPFRTWLRPSGLAIGRSLFLRGMGAIYLMAFLSWWVQAVDLVGENGLVPMANFLERADDVLTERGESKWAQVPTLFWFGSSDFALHLVCALGTLFAIVTIAGLIPAPALLACWALYLSLASTGDVFMNFQWDALLLEAGFLAFLVAPWRDWRIPFRNPPPVGWGERAITWILWIMVAKLMFFSGWTKLAWEDPTWWPDHTALTYHYQTQPIPTWTAWWMHQLPEWFHKASIWPMYFVELVLPFLVFFGARARLIAAIGFAGLMFLILATGNYTYFNWLSIVLCFPLVADRHWRHGRDLAKAVIRKCLRRAKPDSEEEEARDERSKAPKPWLITGLVLRSPFIVLLLLLNLIVMLNDLDGDGGAPKPMFAEDITPDWMDELRITAAPLRSVNGYGLFRTMTTDRPEIVIEGSNDEVTWSEYSVKWKPGPLDDRPPFVAPHQPRVAWQFWFAALERAYHPQSRNAPWLSSLIRKLLEGDPVALKFFDQLPFDDEPPRFLRAKLYLYEFTNRTERRESGNWWKREEAGLYLPPVRSR